MLSYGCSDTTFTAGIDCKNREIKIQSEIIYTNYEHADIVFDKTNVFPLSPTFFLFAVIWLSYKFSIALTAPVKKHGS